MMPTTGRRERLLLVVVFWICGVSGCVMRWSMVMAFSPQSRISVSGSVSKRVSRLCERPWNLPDAQQKEDIGIRKVFDATENCDDFSSSSSTSLTENVGEAIQRLGGVATTPTVWTEFARIASELPPDRTLINLGQGFPDWLPPTFCVESLVEAVLDSAQSPHQYTRSAGHPSLVTQLAKRYSKHLFRTIHPMKEVTVTVGASQALYLTLQTIISPGDEVILFEPFFDLYVNQIKLAGGTPVFVPLVFQPYRNDEAEFSFDTMEKDSTQSYQSWSSISGGEWKMDVTHLQAAMSNRTRALILNSPHNPTGKIFCKNELVAIANVVMNHPNDRVVVLSDEVYKYIVHAPPPPPTTPASQPLLQQPSVPISVHVADESPLCRGHIHMASLPGMWKRTVTISSAGKTFSATGWQVGWCIGPAHLIQPIQQLLPYVQFCASTVIQEALARSLPRADEPYQGYDSYYHYLREKYIGKRDQLATALKQAGFGVPDYSITAGGGFFILARIGPNLRHLVPQNRVNVSNPAAPGGVARLDWALCQWMAETHGLLSIPSSPFFSLERVKSGSADEFIRIAFCKSEATIEAASDRLRCMVLQQQREHHEMTASCTILQ